MFFSAAVSSVAKITAAEAAEIEIDLFESINFGDLGRVKRAIESNVDVNRKDVYICTPLFNAAEEGNIAKIKLLIENNANIHSRNFYGNSVLDYISDPETAQLLRAHGVKTKEEFFALSE